MYDPRLFRLDGDVAVVTGAGAGIGRAIAGLFAAAGAKVVVSDLKAETANEVAAEITKAGGKALGIACDVSPTKPTFRPPLTSQSTLSEALLFS